MEENQKAPEEAIPEIISQSPVKPRKFETTIGKQITFYEALREISVGEKVTKDEWANLDYYGVMKDGLLKLHKPDGRFYDWILSDGDISGTDYVVKN